MKDFKLNIKQIKGLIYRYQFMIFIVFLVACLSVSILMLNVVVGRASGREASPTASDTSFDEATIERINQLHMVDEPSQPLDFSNRRISPFNE